MANDLNMIAPVIDELEVKWVCGLLGLPPTAFGGEDGMDPRLQIIRSMSTLDIEACPGSGKTTLLVAKLAILASKWTESRRGLCVLSHTNVARREIESRLGNTAAGQGLIRYPHFIGTIHGFVNEFLALPWLRSLGYRVEMIDDETCLRRRWRRLSHNVRYSLKKNRHSEQILRFQDTRFSLGKIRWGKDRWLGAETATYKEMRRACEDTVAEGYYCHDEMFVWANDMLEKMPNMVECLRTRFPFLFIDEVQDNGGHQSELLHRVFVDGGHPVTRQRLGDMNQAIYQYAGQSVDVGPDAFPIADIRTDMPSSYRFVQSIANLADPLAVDPQGLQSRKKSDGNRAHAIFLFNEHTIEYVLERYSQHLITVFSDGELRHGLYTAIGAVHRPGGSDKVPRSVGHYWSAYDFEISSSDPRPNTFVQYVIAGNRLSQQSGEANELVEKSAEGLLRLSKLSNSQLGVGGRKRNHRYVLELLEGYVMEKETYLDFVRVVCVDGVALTRDVWEDRWRDVIARTALCIAGAEKEGDEVPKFLAWNDAVVPAEDGAERRESDNIFRYSEGDSSVAVRVGSIHAAKGETHTATLVLDTFYRAHHLKLLRAWLTGKKSGGEGEPSALKSRQRLHYVAMTRASALLCLAIREDALVKGDVNLIVERGWHVGRVTATGMEWLAEYSE